MTLADANTLLDYWQEFPPAHITARMLAMAKAGFKPKTSEMRVAAQRAQEPAAPTMSPEALMRNFITPGPPIAML